MLPPNTREFIFAGGTWKMPGEEDATCEGAVFHSPTPIVCHNVDLVPPEWDKKFRPKAEWPVSIAHRKQAWLCGVCHDNVVILQQVVAAHEGHVPWPIRREFGNTIRALVLDAWDHFAQYLES